MANARRLATLTIPVSILADDTISLGEVLRALKGRCHDLEGSIVYCSCPESGFKCFYTSEEIGQCYIPAEKCKEHLVIKYKSLVYKRGFTQIRELSLIHICRCRRYAVCRSRWSPYH
eukprot:TRINITY_DN7461_c0_g1_i11.p2 TRINITY_DN7461_c0_g1~~TRINITY_DN7461_c0_g1_i11.p2  ORF type:complete len:117 (-),score=25.42 TRINITY_DN7461_c0_g1_i11:15-365(-)